MGNHFEPGGRLNDLGKILDYADTAGVILYLTDPQCLFLIWCVWSCPGVSKDLSQTWHVKLSSSETMEL